MSYLLEANVFMSEKDQRYGLDFCPAFSDWPVHKGNPGTVLNINTDRHRPAVRGYAWR